ncbi:unnamed protein product [Owenia fusiformis]|uniref:Uncharacterized protein n=1 Tax=Owenia fusiformis TaxID=6347 RepID=A0A8J1XJ04_OWEFU|nr:unnamed protein product [Owenia fusiformis]
MLDLNNMDSKNIIMAGYNDCTEEAIRYLTEVELIPIDDPIIIGLREHLSEKQKYLDYTDILHQLELELNASSTIDLDMDTNETSNLRYHSNNDSGCHSDTDTDENDHQNLHNDIYSLSHNADFPEVGSYNLEQFNNNLVRTTSNSTIDVTETSFANDTNFTDGSECSLTSINFALLVQNNPDIAHLTDELLCLLQAAPDQIIDEV